MQYAANGHAYYSVSTPAVFVEYELPVDSKIWNHEDGRRWRELTDLAERHGTHIESSPYQKG